MQANAEGKKAELMLPSDGSGEERTPAIMPCCQVFEPRVQSGHRLASLGFSEYSEHAHRNQGRLPFSKLLGQRISSNHEHGRGNNTCCYLTAFT